MINKLLEQFKKYVEKEILLENIITDVSPLAVLKPIVIKTYKMSGWARKNPRQHGRLYEGCALVRVARPGGGRARHQRADLLRAFRRSTYVRRLAFAQVGVNCAQRAMMHP